MAAGSPCPKTGFSLKGAGGISVRLFVFSKDIV